MNEEELNKILALPTETENLEFKQQSGQISILGKNERGNIMKKSLYGYCVAIGNEGGGLLVLGVSNKINLATGKRIITGTNGIQNIQDAKEKIYNVLKKRIEIENLPTKEGKVQIIKIPSCSNGYPFNFYGEYLMRNGENLEIMDRDTLYKIINKGQDDFSTEICNGLVLDDIDSAAIESLKKRWIKKSGNKDLFRLSTNEILEKLLLIKNGKLTYAALLLLGKEEAIAKYAPNSEFIFEWRAEISNIDFDYKKAWRRAFILMNDEIWENINARNTRVPFKQGFAEFDIWAYDEQSIREAVLNAFAHREYKNKIEPTFIKLSPDKITIKSAGGFLPGVNPDNILYVEGKWRNKLLMEILEKIGLVERSGIGLDRIFQQSIKSGKGLPDFEGSDIDYVVINIPAKVKDINFVHYLEKITKEKQLAFKLKDFIDLENIRNTGKIDEKDRLVFFCENGIIEKIGSGRGTKYILNKDFYEFIDKKSEYTRKRWLNKEEQKSLLLNYLKQHKKGRRVDFLGLFKERKLNSAQINRLLNELSNSGIYFDGKQRSKTAYWRIKE